MNTEKDLERERLANGRLIAAAPDLLNACELFVKWMLCGQPGPYSDSAIIEIAKNAIRKAKATS